MDNKNFCRRAYVVSKNTSTGYTYPRLHKGKTNYVDYYYFLPDTGERKRVKKFFDHIKSKSERNAEMDHYLKTTASKLREGWRPFHENTNDRSYKKFNEVLEYYLNGLSRYDRKKTIHNYTSRTKILRDFLATKVLEEMYCYQFDKSFCVEFLDWLMLERNLSPRTINNYKGWLSSLALWMMERNYIKCNPAASIKKLREHDKKRQPLSPEQLKLIFSHLKKTDKHFLVACLFEYLTFIRPQELSHIKIGDICVQNQTVFVPGQVSKNRRDGMVALNPSLINLLIDLGYLFKPCDYYLFGKGFQPSEKRADADQFNKRWAIMRKTLKLSDEYQFYSLKDSGIRDLANKKGVVVARDQARHTDISTTNKYLRGKDLPAPEAAKHFSGYFTPEE